MFLKAAINHARQLAMVRMIVSVDKCQAIHFRYSPERVAIRGVGVDDSHSNRFHRIINESLRIDDKSAHWKYKFGCTITVEQHMSMVVS
jgi:hypothetical protein